MEGDGSLRPFHLRRCLRAKPAVQLGEIEVPALPVPTYRVSWECAGASLTKHSFGMHVKEACSVLWTDRRLPDRMR